MAPALTAESHRRPTPGRPVPPTATSPVSPRERSTGGTVGGRVTPPSLLSTDVSRERILPSSFDSVRQGVSREGSQSQSGPTGLDDT